MVQGESKRPRLVDRSAVEAQLRHAVGRRVDLMRERLGLSFRQFGALYGVHHTTSEKWCKGDGYPPMLFIVWAWEQYQVPPEWWLVGDDRRAPKWLVLPSPQEAAEKPPVSVAGVRPSADA